MTDNSKMNIYEILDRFNEEVDFKGLDNSGKTTNERDDVITRQTFNNWLREYNQKNTRKIRSKRIDQFNNEWFSRDIEKLIETPSIQKRLSAAYLRATVPSFSGFETSKRVSKKYAESFFDGQSEDLEEALRFRVDNLIADIIKENFILKFKNKSIDILNYLDKDKIIDEFIAMEKVVDEAFNIEDGLYTTFVIDQTGKVSGSQQIELPPTNYFLK